MNEFRAKRVARSFTQNLHAPAADVFPLLCPVREYDWIDGWTCDLIFSESGFAEKMCVFRTNVHGDGERTWVVTHYDPAAFAIGFVIMVDRSLVLNLDIALSDRGDGTSTAVWTNVATALDDRGNALVDAFTEEMYASRMRALEASLNHYLQTGTMLRNGVYAHTHHLKHGA